MAASANAAKPLEKARKINEEELNKALPDTFPASDAPSVTRSPARPDNDEWSGSRIDRLPPLVSDSAEGKPDNDDK